MGVLPPLSASKRKEGAPCFHRKNLLNVRFAPGQAPPRAESGRLQFQALDVDLLQIDHLLRLHGHMARRQHFLPGVLEGDEPLDNPQGHLDRLIGFEDGGEHVGTLFGVGEGEHGGVFQALEPVEIFHQFRRLGFGQVEGQILSRKFLRVVRSCLIQVPCSYPIKLRHIAVQHEGRAPWKLDDGELLTYLDHAACFDHFAHGLTSFSASKS